MKRNSVRIFIGSVVLFTLIFMISCQKKLDSAYLNPNSPVDEPIENIFPGLISNFIVSYSAAGTNYGILPDGIYIGRYLQYWNNNVLTSLGGNGGSQYDEMGGTVGSSDAFGSMWAAFYYGQGQNLNYLVSRGASEKKWDYVGAARAIRAWGWLEMADQYANGIVIKQAFNTSLSTFKYDSISLAYDSCRAACFDALNYLNMPVSGSQFAASDAYFYSGDIQKWKKFIYGLLARSYAYISNKNNYSADSVIKYANLAMTVNGDNAICRFAGAGPHGSATYNYYGPYRGNIGSLLQSAYIADLMSGRNTGAFNGVQDPRCWYLLREDSSGTFHGVTPGQSATTTLPKNQIPFNFWGRGGLSTGAPSTDQARYIFRDTSAFPIMTASEMQFLAAEAYFRKGDKTNALAAYENAISLNFDMLSSNYSTNVPTAHLITPISKAAYLANPLIVPVIPASLTLTDIMLQKYIALYGWGIQETWVDMRRFHYTDTDPMTGKQVYAGFVPAGGTLYTANNGKYVYRARPRYNSEYLYDIPSLTSIGATDASGNQVGDYHTIPGWLFE